MGRLAECRYKTLRAKFGPQGFIISAHSAEPSYRFKSLILLKLTGFKRDGFLR